MEADFLTIFGLLSEQMEDEEVEKFAIIAQRIWFKRNRMVFGGPLPIPRALVAEALETLSDFQKAQGTASNPSPVESTVTRHSWFPPPPGTIKLNWDVSIDKNRKLMGVGLIARDHLGAVKACGFMAQAYISDPMTAEAYAARCGVDFCMDLGLSTIILEGESREILLALRKEEAWPRRYNSFMLDARNKLRSFQAWSTNFVRRDLNQAAHELAQMALKLNSYHVSCMARHMAVSFIQYNLE
jgi:hypothetical protein